MPWPSCLQRPGHLGRRLRVFGSGSAPSTCPVPHGSALTGAPDRALPVSLQPLLCLSSKYGESMRGVRMLDAGHAGDLPGHYRNWRRYQLMSLTRENTRLNVRRKAKQTQAVTLIWHTNTENSGSARCAGTFCAALAGPKCPSNCSQNADKLWGPGYLPHNPATR